MYNTNNNKKELGLFDTFNSMFNEALSKEMRTDIEESETGYLINIDIPGVNKEDIDLSVLDSTLTISVTKIKKETENKNYLIKERSFRSMKRSFYLDNIDEDSIKAKYNNGVLTLEVQKIKPQETPTKTITIE